jgi:hypothetical protein
MPVNGFGGGVIYLFVYFRRAAVANAFSSMPFLRTRML